MTNAFLLPNEQPDFSSPADLIITVNLTPHATFTLIAPSSLSTTLSLTTSESLLGFDRLILQHLDGRGLRVRQPAPGEKGWRVLKSGDWVIVKEEGMWKNGIRGDMWLKVEVEVPNDRWAMCLTAEQVSLDPFFFSLRVL